MSSKEEENIQSKDNNEEEEEDEGEEGEAEEEESEVQEEEKNEQKEKPIKLDINHDQCNTIAIDIKVYQNLLSFLQKYVALSKTRKPIIKITKEDKEIQAGENEENNEKEEEKKQKEPVVNISQLEEKIRKEYEETISKILKEKDILIKENENLKKQIDDLKKQHIIEIEQVNKQITSIKSENEKLLIKNKQMVEIINKKDNKYFDSIKKYPKLISSITKYLRLEERISLSRSNHFFWSELYYKSKGEIIHRKLLEKDSMISYITKEDVTQRFDVTEEQLKKILNDYITNHKVSGLGIRNEIVRSMIFLSKYVKTPLQNFKGPEPEPETPQISNTISSLLRIRPGGKGEIFVNKLNSMLSIIKGGDEEEGGRQFFGTRSDDKPPVNYITFPKDEYKDLFSGDQHILETLNKEKSINVKFEYTNPEEIKDLLGEFFKEQLPKSTYQNFLSKICEKFSDLLWNCYLALKDIKDLEILKHALYCRYMKYKLRTAELEIELRDLNQIAKSTKESKEMLLKQKNEVEIKYNNSMMVISQFNSEKAEKDKEIKEVKLKMSKQAENYDKFKTQIIKEYKKIQSDFSLTKKERDLFKGTLIDFKNYFVKFISDEGEIIV